MPEAVALGNGPVAFTTQDGHQLLIPLSALSFDASGTLTVSNWPPYTTYKSQVDAWLNYLVASGELTPGAAPPPKPAILIQAADPGAAGNYIQVVISNVTQTTFDATLTETDTYVGLSYDQASPSFIKTVLGTETTSGTKPGLVHILAADTPTTPKAGSYALTGGGASAKSAKPVAGDPSGTAFNVEAKKVGKDGDNTTVTIANVDGTAKTFTLSAVWTSSVTGIQVTDLPAKLAGSGYEITVNNPASGYALPAAGPIQLSGGADAAAAQAASATAVAS